MTASTKVDGLLLGRRRRHRPGRADDSSSEPLRRPANERKEINAGCPAEQQQHEHAPDAHRHGAHPARSAPKVLDVAAIARRPFHFPADSFPRVHTCKKRVRPQRACSVGCLLSDEKSRGRLIHPDLTPFALLKPRDGQQAPGGMAEQDCGPDTRGVQCSPVLQAQSRSPSGSTTWDTSVM